MENSKDITQQEAPRHIQFEMLEERIAPTIATTTTAVKVPGPTDFIVTTATNPGGNHPPGHQSVVEVPNRLA